MGCLTVNQKKALPLDGSKDLIWAELYIKVQSLVSIAFLGNKQQKKQTKKTNLPSCGCMQLCSKVCDLAGEM